MMFVWFFFSIQQPRAEASASKACNANTGKSVFFFMFLPIDSRHCGFGGCLIFCPQSIKFADIQLIWLQCHQLISLPHSISNLQMRLIIRAFCFGTLWHSKGVFFYQLAHDSNSHLNTRASKSEFCLSSSEPALLWWSHFNSLKHHGTSAMSNSSLQSCSWRQ